MSFEIRTQDDVFKFALYLYDYLSQQGYDEKANELANLVDSCYPKNVQALEAHLKAFKNIRETVHDLPPQYLHGLDDAFTVLLEHRI